MSNNLSTSAEQSCNMTFGGAANLGLILRMKRLLHFWCRCHIVNTTLGLPKVHSQLQQNICLDRDALRCELMTTMPTHPVSIHYKVSNHATQIHNWRCNHLDCGVSGNNTGTRAETCTLLICNGLMLVTNPDVLRLPPVQRAVCIGKER